MKITFDKKADVVYIYTREEIEEGEAVRTIEVNKDIILDFDKNGKLLGIEVLNASKNMSKSFLSDVNVKNLVPV